MEAEATPPGAGTRRRYPLRYPEQFWRQQRFFVYMLMVPGTAMCIAIAFYFKSFEHDNWIWLAWVGAGFLLAAGLTVYRLRSYVEMREDGLKVSNLLRSAVIDYGLIRGVRVQPLKLAFQDRRKRMVAPAMRGLLEEPALFVRLRGDDSELGWIRKQLGSRIVFDGTLALPVRDPDAVAWEVTSRLPERVGQNLGGGRRRKRRR